MLKLLHNLPVPAAIRAAVMAQFNAKAADFNKSQSGKAQQQADAEPAVLEPHQAHQVHAGHDPEGVQLHDLQLAHHGAAQGVQGQVLVQVHQEKSGYTSTPRGRGKS